MRIVVIGAGPAGLLFAYLVKRRFPAWTIEVIEQNPADATFGFRITSYNVCYTKLLRAAAGRECDSPDLRLSLALHRPLLFTASSSAARRRTLRMALE